MVWCAPSFQPGACEVVVVRGRMVKLRGLAIVAASVVCWGQAQAAVTRTIPVTKLQPIIRQGLLSAIDIIRDKGTVGLRRELEQCYRKIAQTHDQRALVYCVTQDRYGVESLKALFPQMEDDPYFNWNAFAARGAKATGEAVQPLSAQRSFIEVLGAMQAEETISLMSEIKQASPHE